MFASFYNLQILSLNFSFLLLLLPLLPPSVDCVSFQKTTFGQSDTSIIIEGGARINAGGIEFNSDSFTCQVGRATYAYKIPLWDSKTGKLSDFTTHFSFSINIQRRPSFGAGIAFFLAPVGFGIPPNSACGFLGLYNLTTFASNASQIVHVEFDSMADPDWDPPFEHVGINNNSLSSSTYTYWNASFHDKDYADAWIAYDASTKNLSVSWKYPQTPSPIESTGLSYIIDLREVLPEWVTVGFSAASANFIEQHRLQSWDFSSSFDSDKASDKHSKQVVLIVGITVPIGVFIALVVIAVAILWIRRQKNRKATETANLSSINNEQAGPRKFSFEDLKAATNNFADKLGEGGFGAVYEGKLDHPDIKIAVKRISRRSKQGKKEYVTEVKVISQLRHRNLVQLIGWCHDRGEFLLVYEFMSEGSLDSHLFGEKTPLVWAVRYKIVLGLASALLYLHEEWEKCVVHRDVKSSNVMLDSGFNVKLGDFGFAKLFEHELGPQSTGLAGTEGYMAPEYKSTHMASKESDVYSFGVVALEIATGRRAIDPLKQNSKLTLVEWVWDLYGNDNLSSAIDEKLPAGYDTGQVEFLMKIGLWCAHPDCSGRPSISKAKAVLYSDAPLPNIPTNMPVPPYAGPSAPN